MHKKRLEQQKRSKQQQQQQQPQSQQQQQQQQQQQINTQEPESTDVQSNIPASTKPPRLIFYISSPPPFLKLIAH